MNNRGWICDLLGDNDIVDTLSLLLVQCGGLNNVLSSYTHRVVVVVVVVVRLLSKYGVQCSQ